MEDFFSKHGTAQKMKFSIKDFVSKWLNPQETADLVTFTEKILDGKLHFLCSVSKSSVSRELALSDQGFGVIRKSSWSLHIAFEKSWKLFLILNFNKNLFLYYFSQSWSLLWFLMIVSNIKFCLLKYYW